MPRNKTIEKQLKRLFGFKKTEFVEPYQGGKGNWPAKIYSQEENLENIYKLFINDLNIKYKVNQNRSAKEKQPQDSNDILVERNIMPNFEVNQIIIKTEKVLEDFKSLLAVKTSEQKKLLTSDPLTICPFISLVNMETKVLSKSNNNSHKELQTKLLDNSIDISAPEYNAMMNLSRAIVIRALQTPLINSSLTKLRKNIEKIHAISLSEIKDLTFNNNEKMMLYFFKSLVEMPQATRILEFLELNELSIRFQDISTIAKFFLADEIFSDKTFPISLPMYIQLSAQGKPAEDGGQYKISYTEIDLFSDASFEMQNDGSLIILFNKTKSYEKNYLPDKRFHDKLDKELDHLFNCVGITAEKINGSYHNGCLFSKESVEKLKANGVVIQPGRFNHEIVANDELGLQIYRMVFKFFHSKISIEENVETEKKPMTSEESIYAEEIEKNPEIKAVLNMIQIEDEIQKKLMSQNCVSKTKNELQYPVVKDVKLTSASIFLKPTTFLQKKPINKSHHIPSAAEVRATISQVKDFRTDPLGYLQLICFSEEDKTSLKNFLKINNISDFKDTSYPANAIELLDKTGKTLNQIMSLDFSKLSESRNTTFK